MITPPAGEFPRSPLNREARVLRLAHIAIGLAGISSLGYVWFCALTGRRDRILGAAVATLSVQGVGLVIGRGNCPLGPLQQRLGDPTPLFELVLPARAAKAAIPLLATLALGGVAIVALRSHGGAPRSPDRK